MAEDIYQIQIDELKQQLQDAILKDKENIPDHTHTGFDVSKVLYDDIDQKKIYIVHTIQGAAAATAANYSVFFPYAPFKCYLNRFFEIHQTAGTDGGAVTLNIEKLTSTQALGSGVDMLESALSLKATADTAQEGQMTLTTINRYLEIGDRMAMKDAGTLTDVANVSIICELIVV